MPQPTSSHAKGKVEKVRQHCLPFWAQRVVQDMLRLREALCLGGASRGTHRPRGLARGREGESHLPVRFPVQKSRPAKGEVSGSWVQGCPQAKGWISQYCLSFGYLPLYELTAKLPSSRALGTLVLLLASYLSCLNGIADCSSCCHDSDFLPGTKESVQGWMWWHCGLSYFPPLQPLPLALLFPSNSACRVDACVLWGYLHLRFQCQICAFTHLSFLSSSVYSACDNAPILLTKARRGNEEQAVF